LSEVVQINRARVAEALGLAPTALVSLHQVHSADVVHLSGSLKSPINADGMVTATPGLGLAILTADCQPVLFADPVARVIGAAHAGWRGAQGGVLEATVEAMVALGAKRANIAATIGPTISQKAYEVGPEFFETFTDDDPTTQRFFAQGQGDRMLFDLPAYGLHRLRAAGVGQTQWTRHCTYSDPDRFYSYRRTTHAREADYGRLISVIRL
jgi:YfiH family protein